MSISTLPIEAIMLASTRELVAKKLAVFLGAGIGSEREAGRADGTTELIHLLPETLVLRQQVTALGQRAPLTQPLADGADELFIFPRLDHESGEQAVVERCGNLREIDLSREQDAHGVGCNLARRAHELEAFHAWHLLVADEHVDGTVGEDGQRRIRTLRENELDVGLFHHQVTHRLTDARLVIYEKYR